MQARPSTLRKYWEACGTAPIPEEVALTWVQAHDEKTIHVVIDYVVKNKKGLYGWEDVDYFLTDPKKRTEILASVPQESQ